MSTEFSALLASWRLLMSKCFSILVVLAFCFPARAWDDGGHMLIAQIAYSQLSGKAKKQANELLKALPDERRSTPVFTPRAYDFVSAACWMDDIRGVKKYDELKPLHYINVSCGGEPRDVKTLNALHATHLSENKIVDGNATKQEKAVALAILLHVVGDVHQPLHTTDQDLGGNTFPISGVPDLWKAIRRDGKSVDKTKPPTGENAPVYQRLHAFWDSAYRYDLVTNPRHEPKAKALAPLYFLGRSSYPLRERIEKVASDLVAHYLPSNQALLTQTSAAAWITESNKLSCDFAFQTPRNARPSDEYLERAHDESCSRIALAGYRLARLLNQIFDSPEE